MAKPTKRIYVTEHQEQALRRMVDLATNGDSIDHSVIVPVVHILAKLDAKGAT